MSVFRNVSAASMSAHCMKAGIIWASSMRLTWAQHWQAARMLQSHGETDLSGSLWLMAMVLLMLAEDLLELEIAECLAYADR